MIKLTKRILYTTLAVTVLCCTVACSTAPRKTAQQQGADDQLKQQVESALNSDKTLYASHIRVHADNGVVRLSGIVWNDEDLYQAQHLAEHVSGVTKVVSELRLEREGHKAGD